MLIGDSNMTASAVVEVRTFLISDNKEQMWAHVYDILQTMREIPRAGRFIRLVMVVALSTSFLFLPVKTNSAFADTSLVFTPIADSYVDSSLPSNNFGAANPLLASASVRRALLIFNITLPAGSTVT